VLFRSESEYDIELAAVSTAQPLTGGPEPVVVNVRREGSLFLGQRPVDSTELERELRAAQARYARQAVVVRGDAQAPYQHVMAVLDRCRRAQIVNVQLANRVEEPASP